MKKAASCRAYRLGVVNIDGVATDEDRIGSERVGTSDHRAEVARITDLITKHDQPRIAGQCLVSRDINHLTDRNQALWSHCGGQRGNGAGWRHPNPSACMGSDVYKIKMVLDAVVANDQLGHRARPTQCFGDGLPTLREETPGQLPFLSPQ